MTDLDSLPFHYDTPATVTVASRHKHRYPGLGLVCSCGHVRDGAASRRGRLNRRRGNDQERDWCHRLAMIRVGHHGGPEDGIATNGMFVGQAKSFATHRFPTWLADELAKLPRSEGRIPILGILETPGPARDHRPRRLVVMDEADFIALHVGAGGER